MDKARLDGEEGRFSARLRAFVKMHFSAPKGFLDSRKYELRSCALDSARSFVCWRPRTRRPPPAMHRPAKDQEVLSDDEGQGAGGLVI